MSVYSSPIPPPLGISYFDRPAGPTVPPRRWEDGIVAEKKWESAVLMARPFSNSTVSFSREPYDDNRLLRAAGKTIEAHASNIIHPAYGGFGRDRTFSPLKRGSVDKDVLEDFGLVSLEDHHLNTSGDREAWKSPLRGNASAPRFFDPTISSRIGVRGFDSRPWNQLNSCLEEKRWQPSSDINTAQHWLLSVRAEERVAQAKYGSAPAFSSLPPPSSVILGASATTQSSSIHGGRRTYGGVDNREARYFERPLLLQPEMNLLSRRYQSPRDEVVDVDGRSITSRFSHRNGAGVSVAPAPLIPVRTPLVAPTSISADAIYDNRATSRGPFFFDARPQVDHTYNESLDMIHTYNKFLSSPRPQQRPYVAGVAGPAPQATVAPFLLSQQQQQQQHLLDHNNRLSSPYINYLYGTAPAAEPVVASIPVASYQQPLSASIDSLSHRIPFSTLPTQFRVGYSMDAGQTAAVAHAFVSSAALASAKNNIIKNDISSGIKSANTAPANRTGIKTGN